MNTLFMAFKTAQSSESSAASFDRYIGVAKCKILAVNPTAEELSKIYGREVTVQPYVNTVDRDGKKIKQVRLDFIVATNPDCGVDTKTKVTFFVTNEVAYNGDKTKVEVIDKYGRTAWAPVEVAKAKGQIMYSNGPADIDKDYRPLYKGEKTLTMMIRKYLCLPDVRFFDSASGVWKNRNNMEDSEGVLDSVSAYFNGDFTELKEILNLVPNNEVRMMFGVRTTDDNKQYQQVYDRWFETAKAKEDSALSRFQKSLSDEKARGAFQNSEFEACAIKIYVNTPTPITPAATTDDLPMGDDPWA